MSGSTDEIRSVKRALASRFLGRDGIIGFGIGADQQTVNVYVNRVTGAAAISERARCLAEIGAAAKPFRTAVVEQEEAWILS